MGSNSRSAGFREEEIDLAKRSVLDLFFRLFCPASFPAGSLGDFVEMDQNPDKRLSIVAVAPGDLARALSAASGRKITEQQVRAVAEDGGLLDPGGTINLLKYTAYLAKTEGQHE